MTSITVQWVFTSQWATELRQSLSVSRLVFDRTNMEIICCKFLTTMELHDCKKRKSINLRIHFQLLVICLRVGRLVACGPNCRNVNAELDHFVLVCESCVHNERSHFGFWEFEVKNHNYFPFSRFIRSFI